MRSLLIVDDDVAVLRPLSRYLSEHGYEVFASSIFEDAKHDIATIRPDVLITDVRLGAFNGLQLAILARAARPDAQIIVFSGFDDPVLKAEAERLGASYLLKPVSGRSLLAALGGA